mmetsp:Transcript_8360/g.18213  ORF Transcript_8360/g.18213 Transcript_8360/m.18213 type:complete len:336 (-) Transcript_8360:224-1231(-)
MHCVGEIALPRMHARRLYVIGCRVGLGRVGRVGARHEQRQREAAERGEHSDRHGLKKFRRGRGEVPGAPDRDLAIKKVEERAEQTSRDSEQREDWQLLQLVCTAVRLPQEGAKGDQARVRELSEVLLRRREEQVERHRRANRAEECAPRQRLRPVRRSLLHGEEDAADGCTEGGGDAGGGASRDEVALVVVVAKRLEPHGAKPARLGRALRDARCDDGARMDHRTLLADHKPARHRAEHAHHLGEEDARAQHPRYLDALKVGFDLGYARSSGDWRDPDDEDGGDGDEREAEHRVRKKGAKPGGGHVTRRWRHRARTERKLEREQLGAQHVEGEGH